MVPAATTRETGMTSTTPWTGLGCACLLACVMGQAQAAPAFSASATIEGLSYRLVDLDENDGIAPTLTFIETADGVLGTRVQANRSNFVGRGTAVSSVVKDLVGDAILSDSVGGVVLLDGASATAAKRADGLSSTVDASAQEATAWLDPAGVQNHISFDGALFYVGSSASSNYGPYFQLSPNTQLVIDGVLKGSVALDPYAFAGTRTDAVQQDLGVGLGVYGGASANFYIRTFADPDNRSVTTFFDGASLSTGTSAGLAPDGSVVASQPLTVAEERAFHIQITNANSASVLGSINSAAQSYGALRLDTSQVTPAVPEPSTWMLMGLGVALMGWRVRNQSA
ncbi:MAG: PEP-CTERM sorting domain-containing protein [Rubrivivax sp.]|nr:MAG: PEP-CTERM sorting domain-containing protein [Rubrivivax sp.]